MKKISLTSPIVNDLVSKPLQLIRYEDSENCKYFYKERVKIPEESVSLTNIINNSIQTYQYNVKDTVIDSRYIVKVSDCITAGTALFDKWGHFYPDAARRRSEYCGQSTLFNLINPFGLEIPEDDLQHGYIRRELREKICKSTKTINIGEPVFFLPVHCSIYGHLLLEGLGRFWALSKVREYVKNIKILTNMPRKAWFIDLVAPFGFGEKDIIFLDNEMAFGKEIWVTSPLATTNRFIARELREVFKVVFDFYYDKTSSYPDKVYLSRSLSKLRRLSEEPEVEFFLKEKGYTVIHPENLDIQSQVNLFNTCKDIVCPIGSAHHNVLYNQTNSIRSNLMLASKNFYAMNAFIINGSYGINTSCFYGESHTLKGQVSDWSMDYNKFKMSFGNYL